MTLFGESYKENEVIDLEEKGLMGDYYSPEVSRALRNKDISADYSPEMPVIGVRIAPWVDYVYEDFSIKGFTKETPTRVRGRKVSSQYFWGKVLAVRKTFSDAYEDGRLVGIDCFFEFFNFKGEVVDSKTERVVKFSVDASEAYLQSRREKQFSYLRALTRGTPLETYINILMSAYKDLITDYEVYGSMAIEDRIVNETDPQLGQILAVVIPRVDDPTKTISLGNSIRYQIGTYELE